MKPELGFPSFKLFKAGLLSLLAKEGFSATADVAVKDVCEQIRGQVVVSGNNHFLSIIVQIALPEAARAVAGELKKRGIRRRFNSGRVYNPVLSANLNQIRDLSSHLKSAIEQPDWAVLCSNIESVGAAISKVYEESCAGMVSEQDFWWPDKLSEEQTSMLVVGAEKMNQPRLLNFVRSRYPSGKGGHLTDGAGIEGIIEKGL